MGSFRKKILTFGLGLAALTFSSLACIQKEDTTKPDLLLFTSPDYCIFCSDLEDNVLSEPKIQTCFDEHYNFMIIDVYLDLAQTYEISTGDQKTGRELVEEYEISSIPQMIVVHEGEEIFTLKGYLMSPSESPADLYYDIFCEGELLESIEDPITLEGPEYLLFEKDICDIE